MYSSDCVTCSTPAETKGGVTTISPFATVPSASAGGSPAFSAGSVATVPSSSAAWHPAIPSKAQPFRAIRPRRSRSVIPAVPHQAQPFRAIRPRRSRSGHSGHSGQGAAAPAIPSAIIIHRSVSVSWRLNSRHTNGLLLPWSHAFLRLNNNRW